MDEVAALCHASAANRKPCWDEPLVSIAALLYHDWHECIRRPTIRFAVPVELLRSQLPLLLLSLASVPSSREI